MMSGFFGEICVIDVNEKLVVGQVFDQYYVIVLFNVINVVVYVGDYDDLFNVDVIIMIVGLFIDVFNGLVIGVVWCELAVINGKIICFL